MDLINNKLETATASVSVTEAATGTHRYTVLGYSFTKGLGVGSSIPSKTFRVGGYDCLIKYYPDGFDRDAAGHISIHVMLKREVTPYGTRAYYKLQLEDSSSDVPLVDKPMSPLLWFNHKEQGCALNRFMSKSELEASNYLKNDCFTIVCTIWVVQTRSAEVAQVSPIVVPPSDYHRNLGRMLESGVGADVAFDVGGQIFAAHRCVLAAQSPVFQAELYGPMKEKSITKIEGMESMQHCIKIEGIDDVVFKALLHFVYNDSIPEADGVDATVMAQHLFVAADRYGLERLKAVCAHKLYQGMTVDNVSTTLAVAEQHHCLLLKEACLDFIALPGMWDRVVDTDGYMHLTTSCPSVLNDLIRKLNSCQYTKNAV